MVIKLPDVPTDITQMPLTSNKVILLSEYGLNGWLGLIQLYVNPENSAELLISSKGNLVGQVIFHSEEGVIFTPNPYYSIEPEDWSLLTANIAWIIVEISKANN